MNHDIIEQVISHIGNYSDVSNLAQSSKELYQLTRAIKYVSRGDGPFMLSEICDKTMCVGRERGQIRWKSLGPQTPYFSFVIGSSSDPFSVETYFNGANTLSFAVLLPIDIRKQMEQFYKNLNRAIRANGKAGRVLKQEVDEKFFWIECTHSTKIFFKTRLTRQLSIPELVCMMEINRKFMKSYENEKIYANIEVRLSRISPFRWGKINMIAREVFFL